MEENYSFCWRDYGENKRNILHHILAEKDFADVTLVSADEKQIHAHKVILCVSSEFFKSIFTRNPHPHPLIYVNDVNHDVLQSIIEFIYTGQTNVDKSHLKTFIDLGVKLKINGLTDQISQQKGEKDKLESSVSQFTSDVLNVSGLINEESTVIKASAQDQMDGIIYNTNLPNRHDPIFVDGNTIEALTEVKTEVTGYELDVLNGNTDQIRPIKADHVKAEVNDFGQDLDVFGDTSERIDVSKDDTMHCNDAEEKKFFCDKCNYSARFKANLKTHIDSIHDIVTYQCNQCQKIFSRRSALNKHTKTIHKGFIYNCEICAYSSTSEFKVSHHKRTKHNII